MTGPEHYRKAEEYLSVLSDEKDATDWSEIIRSGEMSAALQAAQVHATLALAAATALNDPTIGMAETDARAWAKVAGGAA